MFLSSASHQQREGYGLRVAFGHATEEAADQSLEAELKAAGMGEFGRESADVLRRAHQDRTQGSQAVLRAKAELAVEAFDETRARDACSTLENRIDAGQTAPVRPRRWPKPSARRIMPMKSLGPGRRMSSMRNFVQ